MQMQRFLPQAKVRRHGTENLSAQLKASSCNLVTYPQTFGTEQQQRKLQCPHFSSAADLLRGQLHFQPQ